MTLPLPDQRLDKRQPVTEPLDSCVDVEASRIPNRRWVARAKNRQGQVGGGEDSTFGGAVNQALRNLEAREEAGDS